jgi:hypothetical protein
LIIRSIDCTCTVEHGDRWLYMHLIVECQLHLWCVPYMSVDCMLIDCMMHWLHHSSTRIYVDLFIQRAYGPRSLCVALCVNSWISRQTWNHSRLFLLSIQYNIRDLGFKRKKLWHWLYDVLIRDCVVYLVADPEPINLHNHIFWHI